MMPRAGKALADTQTGGIKVYCDSYSGSWPLGIQTAQEERLFRGLPREYLPPPGGYCPIQALWYGVAYNRKVMMFLTEKSREQ